MSDVSSFVFDSRMPFTPSPRSTNSKSPFFSPCRSVGLKRRSAEQTPTSSKVDKHVVTPVTTKAEPKTEIVNDKYVTTPEIVKAEPKVKLKNDKYAKKTRINIDCELDRGVEEYQGVENIDDEINKVKKSIESKKQAIQKLKSECQNVKQHNMEELNELTTKWRRACQSALIELVDKNKLRGRECTLDLLLLALGIPFELVKYSKEKMDFYD